MIDETACTPFALRTPCPRCSAGAHEPCAEVEQPPLVGLVQVHVERWRAFDAWALGGAEVETAVRLALAGARP